MSKAKAVKELQITLESLVRYQDDDSLLDVNHHLTDWSLRHWKIHYNQKHGTEITQDETRKLFQKLVRLKQTNTQFGKPTNGKHSD